jgi:hypothetical protein
VIKQECSLKTIRYCNDGRISRKYIAALQTLPGTQSVGEDTVRGGEANETQTFVDGIRAAQPYNATIGNVHEVVFLHHCFLQQEVIQLNMARRFHFVLNTEDNPAQNKTEISLMTVGGLEIPKME